MTTYSPMDLVLVDTADGGQHPEPAYDPRFLRIDGLRWRAGVIKARTGVVIRFTDHSEMSGPGYRWAYPDLLGVTVEGPSRSSSCSVFDRDIESYLSGIEDGALAAQEAV